MALFGGSKSTTATTTKQQGIEGGGFIASEGGSIVQEFPDTVADFAAQALELASQSVAQSGDITQSASESFAALAEREKTPFTEFLPVIGIVAVAVVIIALEWRK